MKLSEIQQKLKAPKNQLNKFGGYSYRNCEDIFEALKPLLGGSIVTVSDEMVQIGDRFYVKATASFQECNDGAHKPIGNAISVTAYARESLDKKGMDAAQITGAASSYARKYALNGLFLIDDTKDADTDAHTEERKERLSYSVPRHGRPADDEPGSHQSAHDPEAQATRHEVVEMQKEGIKNLLRDLKKPLSKKAVKELTGLDFEPQHYDAIYKTLRKELEKTDPIETIAA